MVSPLNIARGENTPIEGRVDPLDYTKRFRRAGIVVLIPFLLLIGRLWYLQIWVTEHYQQLAFNNFIDRTNIPAERGLIFDSKNRVVAANTPSYDVTVTPAFFAPKAKDTAEVRSRIDTLRKVLALTESEAKNLEEVVFGSESLWRYEDFPIKRNITRDQVAQIETDSLHLVGVQVHATSQRYYPFNDLAAHLIGYVNEINAEELGRLDVYGYRPSEMIGRTGIERSFEAVLRGSSGVGAEVVDSRGMPQTDAESRALIGDWQDVPPVPGKNIVLTIDMDLQRIIKEAMRDYESGAIVAIDPRNGHILAISSKPSFNPNSWSGRLSRDEHIASDNDPHKPMLDKSLLGYFPGSIYKIVTALAALEAGLVTPEETLYCPGYYEYGKRNKRFHCWKRHGHDSVALAQAIEGSCDVYFYKVGEKLGMDKLAEYAGELGLGKRTGLGINIESAGLVPTKAWHAKNSSEGFQGGFTLSTAIGQGDTKVTPLQAALAYATIANGGTLYYPQFVDRIETASGQVLFEYPDRIRHKLNAKPETLREIVKGLTAVVNSETGTAYSVRLDYVKFAGKTGTAQVTSKRISNADVEFKYRDHAWFVAFAPADAPEIVIVTFLEHGGGGSSDAAPVTMEILDRYFREIRGYDPMQLKKDQGEPVFLDENAASAGRHLLSEPGSAEPRWREEDR